MHLPLSNGFDAVLVIVDRLTKMRHYVPCHMTDNAEDVSCIFIREIYRLHGAPVSVISDRDIRFVNEFWKHLSQRLQLSTRMTVAHRPKGDDQTERINAILEQHMYLICKTTSPTSFCLQSSLRTRCSLRL